MPRIYTSSTESIFQETCYGAFLTGSLPPEGCLLISGPHVYFLTERPPLALGQALPVSFGPVKEIASALSSQLLAVNAYKAYTEGRRLPAGAALLADGEGIAVFPAELFAPDLSAMTIFTLSFDPLEEVLTPPEAAKLYSLPAKRVQSDAETAGPGGVFSASEARKSGNTYLLLKSATERVYRGVLVPAPAIHPFLLVFSSVEAAELWNRDAGTVRSAAGGAGHASARMQEGDRRKSGRTWLVRREAMERLFGQAVPRKMQEALAGIQ